MARSMLGELRLFRHLKGAHDGPHPDDVSIAEYRIQRTGGPMTTSTIVHCMIFPYKLGGFVPGRQRRIRATAQC